MQITIIDPQGKRWDVSLSDVPRPGERVSFRNKDESIITQGRVSIVSWIFDEGSRRAEIELTDANANPD